MKIDLDSINEEEKYSQYLSKELQDEKEKNEEQEKKRLQERKAKRLEKIEREVRKKAQTFELLRTKETTLKIQENTKKMTKKNRQKR